MRNIKVLNIKFFICNLAHDKVKKIVNSRKKNKWAWLLFFFPWLFSGIYSSAVVFPLSIYNTTQLLTPVPAFEIIPFIADFNSYRGDNIEKIFDEFGNIYNPYDSDFAQASSSKFSLQQESKENKFNPLYKRSKRNALNRFEKRKKIEDLLDRKRNGVPSCARESIADTIKKEITELTTRLPKLKNIILTESKEKIFDLANKITKNTNELMRIMEDKSEYCEDSDLSEVVEFTRDTIEDVTQYLKNYAEECQQLKKENEKFSRSVKNFLALETWFFLGFLKTQVEELTQKMPEKILLDKQFSKLHEKCNEISYSFLDMLSFFYNLPVLEKKAVNTVKDTTKKLILKSFEDQMAEDEIFINDMLSKNYFLLSDMPEEQCRTQMKEYKESINKFWNKFGGDLPTTLSEELKESISDSEDALNIRNKSQIKKIRTTLWDTRYELFQFEFMFLKLSNKYKGKDNDSFFKEKHENEKYLVKQLTHITNQYEILTERSIANFHYLLLISEKYQRSLMKNKILFAIQRLHKTMNHKKNIWLNIVDE